MDWKEVGAKIAKSAPMLGGIIGGPAGGAIGGVVSMVASALGLESENPTPEEVNMAIGRDPGALLKLKELEMRNKETLERIILERDLAYLADRQDARRRQTEHEKATGKTDMNLYFLAWLVIICFFSLVGVLMFITLPEMNIGPVNQLFGAMATGFGMVLQYFFGSSKSSSDKTKALISK